MEMTDTFVSNYHDSCFLDMKRCSKLGTELDNQSVGDFFGIDDLLDFSNEDIGGPIEAVCCTAGLSSIIPTETVSSNCSGDRKSLQIPNGFGLNDPGDLCVVPCDDFAGLEWLSNFVEESFSSGGASATVLGSSVNASKGEQKNLGDGNRHFQSESPVSVLESSACSPKNSSSSCLELAVPGRARSKRSRTGVCIWNTSILAAADSSSVALQSSLTCTITAHSQSPAFAPGLGELNSFPPKAIKRNLAKLKDGQDAAQKRSCLHCGSQRTPQWRAGPLGPKTLCNACGVRYKSGRLLPEYRPAASPTFMESIHSNSHKKVLEMRREKEGERQSEVEQAEEHVNSAEDDRVFGW